MKTVWQRFGHVLGRDATCVIAYANPRAAASPYRLPVPNLTFESSEDLSTVDISVLYTGDMAFIANEQAYYVLSKSSMLGDGPKLCFALHASPCQRHPECAHDIQLATACMLSMYDERGELPSANFALAWMSESRALLKEEGLAALLAERETSRNYGPMVEWTSESFPSMATPGRWLRMTF